MDSLALIANPGSASRKYALYDSEKCLATIHFEYLNDKVVYTYDASGESDKIKPTSIVNLTFSSSIVFDILQDHGLLDDSNQIKTIALRLVAPSSYFQTTRLLDDSTLKKLAKLEPRASLHINASLQEAHMLKSYFSGASLIGISDSAFHHTIPEYARNYAIPPATADKFDIKRFGYHGLSVEATVQTLKSADKLPLKLIVCHLGSGASVTAVKTGKSIDTSMGYSPLEGLIMSTRSGSIDIIAAQAIQDELKLSNKKLQDYLNHECGLLGVSGLSSDIRTLLSLESEGDARAKVALDMYVYRIRQTIGQMAASLGGVDALVFTGGVGERSAPIRQRITSKLHYLGLVLDQKTNHVFNENNDLTKISPDTHPAQIYIIPTNEYRIIAKYANEFNRLK